MDQQMSKNERSGRDSEMAGLEGGLDYVVSSMQT